MIPRQYIEEWQARFPWPENAQVEQDLIIERALIEMFSDDMIRENVAFRGGTALHKIFLQPQARYSEDIDLVQIREGPINPLLKRIREKLAFLGTKRVVNQKAHNNTIIYRFESEIPPVINMRLKIEINCREHFNIHGLHTSPFRMNSSWYSGQCNLTTYCLEELLATKLRALYQRRKGRDLFDLHYALANTEVDLEKVIQGYKTYMTFSVGQAPSGKLFLANMADKIKDREFLNDIHQILRPGVKYDNHAGYAHVRECILERMSIV